MSARELRDLLEGVEDTHELILRARSDETWFADELHAAWQAAEDEAQAAYHAWRAASGPEAYAAYRAAADRSDAAQDALAEHLGARRALAA